MTNCLVWRVVRFELLVVGELNVDGLASKDWSDRSIVIYHGVGCFLCVHFYKSLQVHKSTTCPGYYQSSLH